MNGKILSVIAGVYTVFLDDNTTINISPRGNFRFKKMKPCVGDNVIVENGVIDNLLPRKNQLIRPSVSNLDYGIIVISMKEPEYSSYLLDKFLTMLSFNHISPIIVFSKVDLLDDKKRLNSIVEEYEKLGIPTICFSKKTCEGVNKLTELINGKTVAFAGQTGVGKSSLINAICPTLNRKIGQYSKALNRGKHQTKEVILLPFNDSFLVDTPGFSSLELDMYKEDLKRFFPFFINLENDCYFLDCHHINEPKCVVRNLVERGIIPEEHYRNYIQIYDELIYRKDRFK